jgi:hypothetical protein
MNYPLKARIGTSLLPLGTQVNHFLGQDLRGVRVSRTAKAVSGFGMAQRNTGMFNYNLFDVITTNGLLRMGDCLMIVQYD